MTDLRALAAMVVVCLACCLLAMSLRLVRSWLFERRCLKLRAFDYSGYPRAVALIRYTGETIETDGEGIAIPLQPHTGRYFDVLVLPDCHWPRFKDNTTYTMVTFQKQRWEGRWQFVCPPGVSGKTMLKI
jgi:hypothetical protein